MPELPDVTVWVERLRDLTVGVALERVRLGSPFLLRTVDPPVTAVEGRTVTGTARLGKRVVLHLEGDLHVVVHPMIAGRLHWKARGAAIPGRVGLAALDFGLPDGSRGGTLVLTEASTKKRASLHLVAGSEALRALDRGGLEVLEADAAAFASRLRAESHTLKRALTDPTLFSGIGNAYSDEILHRARLSPMALTSRLDDAEVARLYAACRSVLEGWTDRLRAEAADGFPTHVTAFREGMAVHGRYRQPCPTCGAPVQRIVYAENECNYCAACQNEGRLLADRALSRLLKQDWPRTLEELEEARRVGPGWKRGRG